jgi:hypothetical protein
MSAQTRVSKLERAHWAGGDCTCAQQAGISGLRVVYQNPYDPAQVSDEVEACRECGRRRTTLTIVYAEDWRGDATERGHDEP